MDDSETLIGEYLRHQGHTNVVYEPDGNQPPDLLVNGRIAVEVRRLNQNEEPPGGSPRGLEETGIPLNAAVRKVLASMGPPTDGVSWFVSYRFRRPPLPRKEFERRLKQTLANLVAAGIPDAAEVNVAPGFRIDVRRASKLHPTRFLLGASVDHDTGGFVVAELVRNLSICVAEKTRKVAPFLSKYPEWWLAFVDRIAYGSLDSEDLKQLRAAFTQAGIWDRIILVAPTDPKRGFSL